MKRLFFLPIVLLLILSCKQHHNVFKETDQVGDVQFKPLSHEDFFILRIEETTQVFIKESDQDSTLSDIPFRSFQPLKENSFRGHHIASETYLYLHDVSNEDGAKGMGFYFPTFPYTGKEPDVLFENQDFLSTYPIREAYILNWRIMENGELEIKILDKKETVFKGLLKPDRLELLEINHPKIISSSRNKGRNFIPLKATMNLNENEGLVFHRNLANKKRVFSYPNYKDLGRHISYPDDIDCFTEFSEKRPITEFGVLKEKKRIYFKVTLVTAETTRDIYIYLNYNF